MGAFGDRLRREREMRGISLDEIATATKIGTRMLKALEDEKFDLLPGGIFNKGFVRSYAKFLGIDEDQAVADYTAAFGPEVQVDHLPQLAERAEEKRARQSEPGTISWNFIVVLVLLLAAGYTGWILYNRRKADRESRAAVHTTAPAPSSSESAAPAPAPITAPVQVPPSPKPSTKQNPPAATPVEPVTSKPGPVSVITDAALKTSTTSSSVAKPAATQNEIELVIHTTAESWVSAVADGKTVFSETLPTSTERHVVASRRITLTVGNAGGVQVTYNGAEIPSIGEDGKVKTLVFTPDSFRFENPAEE